MRRSDIGPFGVAALVLTLLLQVTALSQADALGRGVTSVIAAAMTGRLALTWACRRGVPAARSEGLGALVAGTVHPAIPVILSVAALAGGAAFGLIFTVAVGGGTGCLAGGDLARRPPPRRHHRRCARRPGGDRHRRLPRCPRAELVRARHRLPRREWRRPGDLGQFNPSDTVRFCSLRTPVPLAGPPDYDQSSARRDHQASAAVIAPSASRMPTPTSPAVAAQCRGTRARAPGSHRYSSRVSGSGAELS